MTNFEAEATSEKTPPKRLRELANLDNTLKLLVANNPATPVDVLTTLAKSSDRALGARFHDRPTLKAIVANPNTPTEVLMRLGIEFPFELLENCVFNLLLLENPNFISEMPADTLQALLMLSTVPAYIINLAGKRDDLKIQLALANSPQTSKAILAKLVESKTEQIKQAAQLHVNWAGEAKAEEAIEASAVLSMFETELKFSFGSIVDKDMILGRLKAIPPFLKGCASQKYLNWRLDQPGFWENHWQEFSQGVFSLNLRLCLAQKPSTPVEILTNLSTDSNKIVRYRVAENINTPVKILKSLTTDLDLEVRYCVAGNPNIPIEVLTTLATDSSHEVRCCVVQNPNTGIDILTTLATDSHKGVRYWVAQNLKTPVKVLESLATDSDQRVRYCVAGNPKTPVKVLESLATDSDQGVRCSVVGNPKTPVKVLESLATDSDQYIRLAVAQNPNMPASVLAILASQRNKGQPPTVKVSQSLATDSDKQVRHEVAKNPHTPVEVLEILAQDSDRQIRHEVAKNLNTPVEVLESLAKDCDPGVRHLVAKNPNTPVEVIAIAIKYSGELNLNWLTINDHRTIPVLKILAQDSDLGVAQK